MAYNSDLTKEFWFQVAASLSDNILNMRTQCQRFFSRWQSYVGSKSDQDIMTELGITAQELADLRGALEKAQEIATYVDALDQWNNARCDYLRKFGVQG